MSLVVVDGGDTVSVVYTSVGEAVGSPVPPDYGVSVMVHFSVVSSSWVRDSCNTLAVSNEVLVLSTP